MKNLAAYILLIVFSGSIAIAQSSSCPDDLLPRRFMSNGKMGFVDLFDNWKIKPKYFEVSPFENRFAKVRFGNGYGMINCEGEEVVPPVHDELGFFSYGRIWAKNKEGWILWDSSGNQLTENPFDEYKRASIWHSFAWVKRNEKWQILNEENGKLVCDIEFTTVKLLSDTLSLVSNEGYFGIINHKNCKYKIPESIVHAQKVSSEFIKLRFRNKKYDIVNLEGESILKNPYDEIESAGNGLAKVSLNDKWGLITPSGKEILSLEYDSIRSYHYDRLALKKSGKWFYINEKLYPLNDSLYDQVSDFTSSGAMVKRNNSWTVIDLSGKTIYPYYDSVHYHKGHLFALENSKWWLLSTKKDAEKFEEINFIDQLLSSRVKKDGEWGLYDFKNATWLLSPSYADIKFISNDKLLVANQGKKGLIDTQGNILIPLQYSELEWQPGFRNNLFLAKDDKYRLINEKNKSILESDYKIKRDASLFIMRDDKKKYLHELDGDLIFEDKVDSIVVLNGSNYFAIKDKGNWGLMDVKGEELIDTDYEEIKILSEKYIALKKDGIYEVFKTDGKRILNEDFEITEIKEAFDDSFIVLTKNGMQWLENSSKLIMKDINAYQLLSSGQLAIKKGEAWEVRNKEGKSISDLSFTSIDKKNGSEILRSNSKSFLLNRQDQFSIHLPFD